MDYKCELDHSTESWHSEGSFVVQPQDGGEVLKYTIGGLPGQGRAGQVYEFVVEDGVDGAKVLVRDGVRCQPQADTFAQRAEKKICPKCGGLITGQMLNYGGESYHPGCFTCDTCNAPLPGSFTKLSDGRKQCEGCSKKKFCEVCKKSVSGKMMNFNGKLYHPACFVCSVCAEPMGGEIFQKGDQILCKACATKPKEKKSPGAKSKASPKAPASPPPSADAEEAAAPPAPLAEAKVPPLPAEPEAGATPAEEKASPPPAGPKDAPAEEAPASAPKPYEVDLGSYGGNGRDGGFKVTWMLRLMQRGKAWLDHTRTAAHETSSWHAEGVYAEVRPDGSTVQVLHFTVTGCPFGGGPEAGHMYEIHVDGGDLVCEGVRCAKVEDFGKSDAPGEGGARPPETQASDLRPTGRTVEATSLQSFTSKGLTREKEKAPAPPPLPEHSPDLPEGCFSLEELQNPAVWKDRGIEASRREEYLTDAAFLGLFGMTKEDFAKMPKWKRDGRKREHGLF